MNCSLLYRQDRVWVEAARPGFSFLADRLEPQLTHLFIIVELEEKYSDDNEKKTHVSAENGPYIGQFVGRYITYIYYIHNKGPFIAICKIISY